MNFGDNLSNIQNIKYLIGKDEQDLQNQFDSLTLPTKILQIYPRPEGRIVAWILTQHKIVKVDSKKEIKPKKKE